MGPASGWPRRLIGHALDNLWHPCVRVDLRAAVLAVAARFGIVLGPPLDQRMVAAEPWPIPAPRPMPPGFQV